MKPTREHTAQRTRKNRTRTIPLAEALDDRVVPAVVGVGHGAFAAGNAHALRVQEVHQRMMARQEARIEQIQHIHAMRQEHLVMLRQRFQERTMPRRPLALAGFGGNNSAAAVSNFYRAGLNARQGAVVGAFTPAGPLGYGSMAVNHSTAPVSITPVATTTTTTPVSGSPGTPGSGNATPITTTTTSSMNRASDTTTGTTGDNGQSTEHGPFGPGGFLSFVTLPNGDMMGFR